MDALRVGLVGYGGAGRGIHARLLREAGQKKRALAAVGVAHLLERAPDEREDALVDAAGLGDGDHPERRADERVVVAFELLHAFSCPRRSAARAAPIRSEASTVDHAFSIPHVHRHGMRRA